MLVVGRAPSGDSGLAITSFTEQDLATLQLLSVHVGVSVRNIKLYQASWQLHCRLSCLSQLVHDLPLKTLIAVKEHGPKQEAPGQQDENTTTDSANHNADTNSPEQQAQSESLSFVPWVLQVAQELIRAERCSLFLLDEEKEEVRQGLSLVRVT